MYQPQLGKIHSINHSSPATGLFYELIPNYHLTAELETEIISWWDINTIVYCARLNKIPWNRRMLEEIKRRKRCVTIYTWPAGENSSDRSNGSLGHSALKTYSGGELGTGIYVSFYPGDCNINNRHPNCKKNISHFHKWNQDDRQNAIAVDLYGLNIDIINKTFETMHDDNMNSYKHWSTRYNCSDVVLFLLIKGNIKLKLHIYGWETIFALSMFVGNASRNFIYYYWIIGTWFYLRNINNSLTIYDLPSTIENSIKSLLHLNKDTEYRSIFELSKSIIGAIITIPLTYLYIFISFSKTYSATSSRILQKPFLIDTLIIGALSCSEHLIYYFLQKALEIINIKVPLDLFPGNLIHDAMGAIRIKVKSDLTRYFGDFTGTAIKIGLPRIFIISLFVYFKYFYDTTTTPQHVLNITKVLKEKSNTMVDLKQHTEGFYGMLNKNVINTISLLANKTWQHRYPIFGIVTLCVTIGLFARNYKNNHFVFKNENLTTPSIKF